MILATRRVLGEKLMQLHDRFAALSESACRQGCAACCTQKVVVTTLEGLAILEFLERQGPAPWRLRIQPAEMEHLYRPSMTLNAWAAECLKEDTAEEDVAPDAPQGACPFLTAEACPLYAVRPLACRSMLSRTTCRQGGSADMPEEVLALNTVFLQYLEAVDRPGLSGNLIDVLDFLSDPVNRQAYVSGVLNHIPAVLLPNQALPALMVPPEFRTRLRPVIDAIQAVIRRPDS